MVLAGDVGSRRTRRGLDRPMAVVKVRPRGEQVASVTYKSIEGHPDHVLPILRRRVRGYTRNVGEFKIGVRREMWVYLLLAVLLVTTFEWLTYHRRVTV